MNAHNAATSMNREPKIDFDRMSLEELWNLRESIKAVLETKIIDEKREVERRLEQLSLTPSEGAEAAQRRYPAVLPKYQNPANSSETWSGRGRRPAWVVAQLQSGKKLDDLAIAPMGS